MNILILGSGGREHTLAWKIARSPRCTQLFVAPGNAGTAGIAQNVAIQADDFEAIKKLVEEKNIELVVVGPEDPLVKGIRDYFESNDILKHVALIGPGKAGAQLEGSKDFAKQFMLRHNIPTAKARSFDANAVDEAIAYLENCSLPIVLKADGLAAGKGVLICEETEEAKTNIQAMLVDKKFGQASQTVLIEEYLEGIELSVFVLTDGTDYVILPEAKDYKRIGEGDTGLNTGGMGAVSPVDFATKDFLQKVESRIVKPTIKGLNDEGISYNGFIFIGLMSVEGEPFVIEYNVRMGDPETQVVVPRIKNDLLELLLATANGKLKNYSLDVDQSTATTVVAVAGGYPEAYVKGNSISGLADVTNALVIHAGTVSSDYKILTNGGRVLAVTGMGETLEDALQKSYTGLGYIHWDNMYYRKDIGKDILALRLN